MAKVLVFCRVANNYALSRAKEKKVWGKSEAQPWMSGLLSPGPLPQWHAVALACCRVVLLGTEAFVALGGAGNLLAPWGGPIQAAGRR